MTSEFNRFFKSKNLASTYKPTFLKCLLDIGDYENDEGSQWVNQKQNQYEVDLNFVAVRFIRYYWPLKFIFKIKQEATRTPIAVYRILDEFSELIGKKTPPSKKLLCHDKFAEMRLKIIREGIKPQVLKRLLNDCNIYSITGGSNSIIIPKEIVDFMKENKDTLVSALNHTIAVYLERINLSPNIATCLKEITPRITLSKPIFEKMIKMGNSCCFYCGKEGKKFAQEHVVPWNFVRDTQNYNIVPACTPCNSSKHDLLPAKKYLDKLLERNESLESLPAGYSPEMMKNLYENCRIEYHGMEQELWDDGI